MSHPPFVDPIGNKCWGSVEYALLGGKQRSVSYSAVATQGSFGQPGMNYTTVKLPGLGFPSPPAAAGAQICFKLRDSSTTPCFTKDTLCGIGGCYVSLFNSRADCCPTSLVTG